MRNRLSVSLMLMIGLFGTGCVVRTRHLPKDEVLLKADTASKRTLLDQLKARSSAVTTLMVKGASLKVTRPLSNNTAKDFYGTGIIVVNRPDRIALEISESLLTIADMVSDGKQYKISLPHGSGKVGGPAKFGVADIAAPAQNVAFPYNLRPSHILDALFVDGEQYFEDPDIVTSMVETTEKQVDGVHSFYRIFFTTKDGVPLEEIWIDRSAMMEVARKIQYEQDGKREADIRYSNYDKVDNIQFPKTIVISRPIENYVLELDIPKVELNKPVSQSSFDLDRPEGAVDVDLNTGKSPKP